MSEPMQGCPVCGGTECRTVPQIGRLPRFLGGVGLDQPDPETEVGEYEPKRRRKKQKASV